MNMMMYDMFILFVCCNDSFVWLFLNGFLDKRVEVMYINVSYYCLLNKMIYINREIVF